MASMTKRICSNNSCKKEFEARTADVKRGWAKFCCKSCKAIVRKNELGNIGNLSAIWKMKKDWSLLTYLTKKISIDILLSFSYNRDIGENIMIKLNKSNWKFWMMIVFALAQTTDGIIRLFSLGFLRTEFPLEVSKRFAKMMQQRKTQK